MPEILLETRGLSKRYGRMRALDDFSARFESGKIYGLLGRNGAGKTTFLNLVTSRIFPDGGEALFRGGPVTENARALASICYMSEKNLFLKKMKVRAVLREAQTFFSDFDADYARRLSQKFGLDPAKRYEQLSRGYESILRIVVGLASRAPLTIFDEPVLGLDAAVRDLFYRELIEDFTAHPRTVILSTHLIEESADVFDEIVLIKNGRLIEQTAVDDLKQQACAVSGRADAVDAATMGCRVIHNECIGTMKIACVYGETDGARKRQWQAAGLELSPVPIQKLFIYLTGEEEGLQ
jgi:ABC-2 type transport system ATP-binding protein